MNKRIVALDLGGTWMKGAATSVENGCAIAIADADVVRRPNPLKEVKSASEFAARIADFCSELAGASPASIVAATAGEVNVAGDGYLCAGSHLGIMGTGDWVHLLRERYACPVTLINDAEAFLLGVAERKQLPTRGNVAGVVVGTGLGFAVVRDGRWWKPGRRLLHLGAARTTSGDYDDWVSGVRALKERGFLHGSAATRELYLNQLASVLATATNLFCLDQIVLGGGLVDAASASMDLAGMLGDRLRDQLLPGWPVPEIVAIDRSNKAILEGAAALAAGWEVSQSLRFRSAFHSVETERVADGPGLETLSCTQIAERLAIEEARAAARFVEQSPLLAAGAEMIARTLRARGRVVYVGAGTSGRLGALDAVEIPCTFGLLPERFVAVIAGGVADAALTIEGQSEEDTSSIPDLMLLQLTSNDTVVGLSASATAFFVRSGLAYARMKGAATILIHEAAIDTPNLADLCIPLRSGVEAIAGSTRMKAGTATKKALNVLSSTAMVLLGTVRGSEMIDLQCTNEKLRVRAKRILMGQLRMSEQDATALLRKNGFNLRAAFESVAGPRMSVHGSDER